MTETVGKVGRSLTRLVPARGAPEGKVGHTIRIALLAGVFLIVMWLLLAALIGQS